ncbi:MAG: hypothetical protein ACYDCX_07685 [Acidithiobacillus sp.]
MQVTPQLQRQHIVPDTPRTIGAVAADEALAHMRAQHFVVPVTPAVDMIWIPGDWVWQGRWIWGPGRWAYPPHPYARWAPGRWWHRDGRWFWGRGHWMRR